MVAPARDLVVVTLHGFTRSRFCHAPTVRVVKQRVQHRGKAGTALSDPVARCWPLGVDAIEYVPRPFRLAPDQEWKHAPPKVELLVVVGLVWVESKVVVVIMGQQILQAALQVAFAARL